MKLQIDCTYCGKEDGGTKDHVPPKCLFPKPRPSNLVTVPCCDTCRKTQGEDDEYFMRMIMIREELSGSETASLVREKVHRSFDRAKMKGFISSFARQMIGIHVETSSGLYLGIWPGYHADLQRLCRVVTRTTRGLYSELLGTSLPPSGHCESYALEGFQQADLEFKSQLVLMMHEVKTGVHRVIGDGVYEVWAKNNVDTPQASFWMHVFYGKVVFLSLTIPFE